MRGRTLDVVKLQEIVDLASEAYSEGCYLKLDISSYGDIVGYDTEHQCK